MEIDTYRGVWDALADSPGEARNLKMRSQLMQAIDAYIARESITQAVAAKRLGVPRSRVSELVNGRIGKFTIDKLVNMAYRIGLSTTISIGEVHRAPSEYRLDSQRILGIDFTSCPGRRKQITVADCALEDEELAVDALYRIRSFDEFERLLGSNGPWVAAIDLPFGQPRKLVEALGWPSGWKDYVGHVERIGKDAFERAIKDYQRPRPAGQKEHLRRTDKLANSRSPMKLHFQPVGKMFFQGAPRLLRSGANIIPCAQGDIGKTIVEAYPAIVVKHLCGDQLSYKSDRHPAPAHKATRQLIVNGLQSSQCGERYGVRIAFKPGMRDKLVEDRGADLLDAVLCAVQGAWASRQPEFGVPQGCEDEGWIVDPGLTAVATNESTSRTC